MPFHQITLVKTVRNPHARRPSMQINYLDGRGRLRKYGVDLHIDRADEIVERLRVAVPRSAWRAR